MKLLEPHVIGLKHGIDANQTSGTLPSQPRWAQRFMTRVPREKPSGFIEAIQLGETGGPKLLGTSFLWWKYSSAVKTAPSHRHKVREKQAPKEGYAGVLEIIPYGGEVWWRFNSHHYEVSFCIRSTTSTAITPSVATPSSLYRVTAPPAVANEKRPPQITLGRLRQVFQLFPFIGVERAISGKMCSSLNYAVARYRLDLSIVSVRSTKALSTVSTLSEPSMTVVLEGRNFVVWDWWAHLGSRIWITLYIIGLLLPRM